MVSAHARNRMAQVIADELLPAREWGLDISLSH
jgi:hypothetical protein